MSANQPPVKRHQVTAAEHLAGVKAARVWIQALTAEHLLKSQNPIGRQPVNPDPEEKA